MYHKAHAYLLRFTLLWLTQNSPHLATQLGYICTVVRLGIPLSWRAH